MKLFADENIIPAHISALESGGFSIVRVADCLEKGASDPAVLAAATEAERVLITYDKKDFVHVTDHAGVLIGTEDMRPRDVRNAASRIESAYPSLENVVEFLSDWT